MSKPLNSIIKAGWVNFRRNSYLSFAVTGVMALALLIMLAMGTFQFVTSAAITSLQQKVDVSAYFKLDAPEDHILVIKKDLEQQPQVASVQYVSRDAALAQFKERHKDDQLIQESLQQLDSNPLSASLNILARDPSQYKIIAKFLEDHKYRSDIDKINYYENQEVIDRIHRFASTLKFGGLLAALIVALIAVLITFNTVRLTIYNQKQEIEIMRLVGASNWHIRGPYMAEGGIYGLIASLIALVVFYPITYALSDNVDVFIPGSRMFHYFLINSWEVVLITVIVGMLLGIASSFIAIRKHLKI